ncbi:MAG TPA: hypothetical protein VHB50_17335, partial [Bryobacteraceae bacterium]|nr:hypothetical protein [Bryobacteraceae bacterium]
PPRNTSSGIGKATMGKVLAIDPHYDGTLFPTRNATARDYSASGASGKALTSADTALAHLDAISRAGQALHNKDFQTLNRIANSLGAQFGDSPATTYDTIVSMVTPEISKAVIGAAGGEGERGAMAKNFSAAASPEQREQAIAAAAGLLGARVQKSLHAYESTMGRPHSWKLSPESQAVIDRYAKSATSAGGVSVTDPRGVVHVFPNQAAADKFKKLAGMQ